MRTAVSLLGILIALAIVYYLVTAQWSPNGNSTVQPQKQIDITGVQSDLLSIGQAERLYLTTHASYGTLEQLQQDGALSFTGSRRRGYTYSTQVDGGAHFTVTATPSDPEKSGWPTLTIDENLEVSTK